MMGYRGGNCRPAGTLCPRRRFHRTVSTELCPSNRRLCYVPPMRAFLITLLCVALPFAAGARTLDAIKIPCPMQQAHQDMAPSAQFAAGSCCNDAETTAKTGKPCKAGQECQASPTATLLPPILTPVASRSSRLAAIASITPRLHPAGIWRPPALI
jgi:hypothetical protein